MRPRRLLALLLIAVSLFGVAAPAHATIALVISVSAGSTDTNAVTSAGIDTSAATLLVMVVSSINSSTPVPADSKGNTWAAGPTITTNPPAARMYYVKNPTVGSSHTFTDGSGAVSFPSICVFAFSGTNTTANVDQSNSTAASTQAGSVTPSENNEVVVAGQVTTTSTAPTIDGGFSTPVYTGFSPGLHYGVGCSYLIQTTAAAANPTWSNSTDTSALIATFKAAAAAGAVRHRAISQ